MYNFTRIKLFLKKKEELVKKVEFSMQLFKRTLKLLPETSVTEHYGKLVAIMDKLENNSNPYLAGDMSTVIVHVHWPGNWTRRKPIKIFKKSKAIHGYIFVCNLRLPLSFPLVRKFFFIF